MEDLMLAIKDLVEKAFQGAAYMVGAYGAYAILDAIFLNIGLVTNLPPI